MKVYKFGNESNPIRVGQKLLFEFIQREVGDSPHGKIVYSSADTIVVEDKQGNKFAIRNDEIVDVMTGKIDLPPDLDVVYRPSKVDPKIAMLISIRSMLLKYYLMLPSPFWRRRYHGLSSPPGQLLGRLADFFFSKKTVSEVVTPILSDMQMEYFEALAENRKWKAMWVRIRGYWSFWKAMALFNILRAVANIWRKVSSV